MYGALKRGAGGGSSPSSRPVPTPSAAQNHSPPNESASLLSNLGPERHVDSGQLLKSVVYGAVDGVLTSFAIVSGAAGGGLHPSTVLILGVSSLVADAVAMGVGDAVSTAAYREHVQAERRREEWEFESFPEGEVVEMVDLYESRGLPRDTAEKVVGIMSNYKELFLDVMVVEELGLTLENKGPTPLKLGLTTGVSFFLFGSVPLLAYVVLLKYRLKLNSLLLGAVLVTLLVLFGLGALKSKFTSSAVWWRSGFEFMLLGGAVALTSYYVGTCVDSAMSGSAFYAQ